MSVSVTSTSATITYTAGDAFDSILEYKLSSSSTWLGGSANTTFNAPSSTRRWDLYSLNAGTTYNYRIFKYNTTYTSTIAITSGNFTTSPPPNTFTATLVTGSATSTSLTFNIAGSATLPASGTSAFTSSVGSTSWTRNTLPTTTGVLVISGLTPNTAYTSLTLNTANFQQANGSGTTLKGFTASSPVAGSTTVSYTVAVVSGGTANGTNTLPTSFTVVDGSGASITSDVSGSILTMRGLTATRAYTFTISATGFSPVTTASVTTLKSFTATLGTIGTTTVTYTLSSSFSLPPATSDVTVTGRTTSWSSGTNTLTISGLSAGTAYTFAITSDGFETKTQALVTTLKTFTATYSSATTSTLVYTISSSFTPLPTFSVTAGGASITSELSGNRLTLSGLAAGTSYTPVITASGWATPTLTAQSTQGAFTISLTPYSLGDTTVVLQLTPSGATVLPTASSAWDINRVGLNTTVPTSNISFNGANNRLTVTNLTQYTLYGWNITPTGMPTQFITFTTLDLTLPGAITGFEATVNANSIVLSWAHIFDGGSNVSYELTNLNSNNTVTLNSWDLPYTVSSLAAGTAYNFSVRAVDAVGNQGPYYNSVALTPYGDSPAMAIAGGKTAAQFITESVAVPVAIAVPAIVAARGAHANIDDRRAAIAAAVTALRAKVQAAEPTQKVLTIPTMSEAAGLIVGNSTYLESNKPVNIILESEIAFADLGTDNEDKYIYSNLPLKINVGSEWILFAANNTYTTSASATPVAFSVSTAVTEFGVSIMVHGLGSAVFTVSTSGVKCFLANAPVLTPGGYKPISTIAEGDLVMTTDGRAVPVRAVKVTRYAPSADTYPFVIKQGMWGAMEDLMISPNHRVAVGGGQMVEAKRLGLKQAKMRDTITYYNLQLPNWHTDNMVVAGVAVESMAPPIQRRTVPAAQFMALLKRTYGTITEAHLHQIRARCKLLPNGMVEFPCMQIGQ